MKKFIRTAIIFTTVISLASGCGAEEREADGDSLKIGMVADTGQIMEDSFQYSVWKGIEDFKTQHHNVDIKYLESDTEEEYLPNLDLLADEGYDLVFGAGFALSDAVKKAAKLNPDIQYVLLDNTFSEKELKKNLTGIDFASEVSAFLAGYVAGSVTETGKVGFIGGIRSDPLYKFEYGYRYGVLYAAREREEQIEVEAEYSNTYQEVLAGKELALDMYEDQCDVIFQAAGECGLGVIEAAKLRDRWVIGVDADQYEEAPDNILTSALKRIDKAAQKICEEFAAGELAGGGNYLFGLDEEAVGLPSKNPNLTSQYPGLYEKAIDLQEAVRQGGITVPTDQESFDALSQNLRQGGSTDDNIS